MKRHTVGRFTVLGFAILGFAALWFLVQESAFHAVVFATEARHESTD